MGPTEEQDVRERAYALWEKEGSQHGRDLEFWERARLMLEAESAARDQPAPPSSPAPDQATDEALKETFPASDPPAFTAGRV